MTPTQLIVDPIRLFGAIFAVFMSIAPSASADTPTTEIAGRTISQWSDQLDDEDRVVRLRALRSLAAFGSASQDELIGTLEHSDAAMRYVAAVALGDLGEPATSSAKKQLKKMAKSDSSLAVKNATAYALCRSGLVDEYLPQLIDSFSYPERGMAVGMIDLVAKIGSPASAALEPLEKLIVDNPPSGKGDYHIGGAARQAARKIRGDVK